MPELKLEIGGREFTVSCQPGEELHLQTAASVLGAEANIVNESVGRVPESRMLLMAGLMLADKMAATTDQERYADEKIEGLEARLRESEDRAIKLQKELAAAQDKAAETNQTPDPDWEARLRESEDRAAQLYRELEEAKANAQPAPAVASVNNAVDLDTLSQVAKNLEDLADTLEQAVNA